ncbi:hypothetical protein NDU88_011422 [Pleurodeles waltl]|uniref:Reverse transcriptase zinc-binding domain-containing protein n=1 Tax=Pleurodeles waltl TaxID=8319 RepID=A0AAV7PYM4_PLEWA|nr:hypothetical protein NDU88_011422 [Pleurodeles waltl]
MEEVETRISRLEDDAGSQQVTREAIEKQLEDTQWKLTDLEDRLRRNNLRVLGIPEGVEGSDTHSFMVALFKEAFPDLQQWDWDREIQRAHQFPFNRAGLSSAGHDMPEMTKIPLVVAINRGEKIGMIYTLLVDLQSDDMVHQNERWSKGFGKAGDWMGQSLIMADTTLLSANLKTQHYKTLVDLYYTPAKLKKIGKSSGLCNRCGEEEAEILHMFYVCPMLRVLLCEIEVFLKKITGCNVQLSAMLVLLGVMDSTEGIEPPLYKIRRFLFVAMAIFRLCIATDWIKKEPPTFEGWRSRLLAIYNIELSLYKLKGHKKRHRGEQIWAPLTKWLESQDAP